MTDSRAALAVLIDCYNASLPVAEVEAEALQKRLAERGVLLVTDEDVDRALRMLPHHYSADLSAALWAALSGEVTA